MVFLSYTPDTIPVTHYLLSQLLHMHIHKPTHTHKHSFSLLNTHRVHQAATSLTFSPFSMTSLSQALTCVACTRKFFSCSSSSAIHLLVSSSSCLYVICRPGLDGPVPAPDGAAVAADVVVRVPRLQAQKITAILK